MTAIFPVLPRPSKVPIQRVFHTFIATSPLHMEKKLRMTPEQVLEQKQTIGTLCPQFGGRHRVQP